MTRNQKRIALILNMFVLPGAGTLQAGFVKTGIVQITGIAIASVLLAIGVYQTFQSFYTYYHLQLQGLQWLGKEYLINGILLFIAIHIWSIVQIALTKPCEEK